MRSAFAIAAKDLRQWFASPLAWSVLAIALALLAYGFLLSIESFRQRSGELAQNLAAPGVTDLVVAPFFASLATLLVLVAPLVTMRGVCEEQRHHTLPLLLACGASDFAIVAGKWLAASLFLLLLIALAAAMPLSLGMGTTLDLGKIAAGLIGLALLALSLAAIGTMCASYAQHPAGAALATLAAGFFLWMVDSAARAQGVTQEAINWLAMPSHLTAFVRGIVASVDVVYFLLVVVLALALAAMRVAKLRERG